MRKHMGRLVCLLAGLAAAAQAQSPQSKAEALQMEKARVEQIMNGRRTAEDALKYQLRLASMALDAGDRQMARETLMQVTQQLSDMLSDKEFQRAERRAVKTLGGEEADKFFLGEPYEQMFAFMYLGVLDFQAGDYEYARASFRSAQAADEMSNLEGHRSDCYLAFLLEALASKALGETEAATEAFALAERAYVFRRMMDFVPAAFQSAARSESGKDQDLQSKSKRERRAIETEHQRFTGALAMVASYLGVGLANESNPRLGIGLTFDYALARLDDPGKFSEAVDYLELFDKKEITAGVPAQVIQRLREVVDENLDPAIEPAAEAARGEIRAVLARYADPATNVYVLNELGVGPTKRRGGAFGSQQVFVSSTQPDRHRVVLVEPAEGPLLLADGGLYESVDYQALTRGGRYMDYLLAGQATTKRRLGTAADVFDSMPSAYADAIAGVLRLFARGIHAEADIRAWNELPSEIGLLGAALPPGSYRVAVHSYDRLGRIVPGESPVESITVEAGRPTLVAARPAWH